MNLSRLHEGWDTQVGFWRMKKHMPGTQRVRWDINRKKRISKKESLKKFGVY